jgi:SAM-dependent methyltransferase
VNVARIRGRNIRWFARRVVLSGIAISRALPRNFGWVERQCPICGYQGFFAAQGWPLRPDARCPACDGLERHRLFWLVDERCGLVAGRDVLHFAPERCIAHRVKTRARSHRTADLFATGVDLNLNLEDIALSDASVDVVLLLHVLEHVDARATMREIYRILRPGGYAVCMTPVIEGWDTTLDSAGDASLTKRDREILFGQADHVRWFAKDIRELFVESGFSLTEETAEEPEVRRYALTRGDKVFLCAKPEPIVAPV